MAIYVKECKKCGVIKPGDDFFPHRTNADRLEGQCKDCHNKAYKARKASKRVNEPWFIFD